MLPQKRPKPSLGAGFRVLPIRRVPALNGIILPATCNDLEVSLVCTLADTLGHGKVDDVNLEKMLKKGRPYSGVSLHLERLFDGAIWTSYLYTDTRPVVTEYRALIQRGLYRVRCVDENWANTMYVWCVVSSMRVFMVERWAVQKFKAAYNAWGGRLMPDIDDSIIDDETARRLLSYARGEIETHNASKPWLAECLKPFLLSEIITHEVLPFVGDEVLCILDAPKA